MKAIRVHQFGGPEVLQCEEVAVPEPGAGQVLVRVEAVGVNPVETYWRAGANAGLKPPYTPGTDASGTVEELGPDVPMHFTAFHPDYKLLDRPPTPATTLSWARAIALSNGARYAYTGNVHDDAGGSTYCHACGEKLIGRDWYVLKEWNLDENGRCRFCHTPCAGHFNAQPGNWGARRQPVRLANFRV